jgi:tetratricopeptide (TPR) repeat protein
VRQALAAAERDPALDAALGLHRQGKLAEALRAYQAILGQDGQNADAAFLCGMAALQAGAGEAAAHLFVGAIGIDPSRADFHANLGLARARGGDLTAGLTPLIRAMLLSPDEPSIAYNLGQVGERAGLIDRAFISFRASAHLQPEHVLSWIEFGAVARLKREPGIANIALLNALGLDDAAPRAWFNIAMLRADQSLDDDAETGFRRAMELDPTYVEAFGNLGNHLRSRKRREEAGAVLLNGIARHPVSARLWSGLSAVAFDDDRIDQADMAARRAALIEPSHVDGVANLAQSLHRAGATGQSVRYGARARLLAPEDARLEFNEATYLLGDGDLGGGWDAYEARLLRLPEAGHLALPGRRWTAGPPPGRHLLVVAEQGLGDELLFATCLPELAEILSRGDLENVTVECDPRLDALFRRTFPDFETVTRPAKRSASDSGPGDSSASDTQKIDCHVFAGSLPRLFRRSLSDFALPSRLVADPARVAYWRDYLKSRAKGPVFGLTWRSMSRRDRGDVYYPPLQALAPILGLAELQFVTLQYDDPEPDLREIEERFDVEIIRPDGLDPMNNVDEVAALLMATDGMISAYTAALNLAGFLGVPAYTATYGYYWPTLGTDALPWYPSVTIEMRTGADDWDTAIQRLTSRVQADLRA